MKKKEMDEYFMRMAIELAQRGRGFVNPNPMVGAVIVKNGCVIGKGYHKKYGDFHAERNAIMDCVEDLTGAAMYVTLEPCCHYGKTPPCTEAIIESGIQRVVIGLTDPNPKVAGKGIECLQNAGIEVDAYVLLEECKKINEVFLHYITKEMPYIVMKYAMTLDGKIAAYTGASKWITSKTARKRSWEDRHRYMAIMVGSHTVLTDNPMLNCRIPGSRQPIRIICDTDLKTPLSSELVKTAKEIPVLLATACKDKEKIHSYTEAGCEIIHVERKEGMLDLPMLLKELGSKKIDSILVEGGSMLHWSFLKERLVNKVQAYIAPKLLGGEEAKSPIGGMGFAFPDEAVMLENIEITVLDEDFLIEGEVKGCLQES